MSEFYAEASVLSPAFESYANITKRIERFKELLPAQLEFFSKWAKSQDRAPTFEVKLVEDSRENWKVELNAYDGEITAANKLSTSSVSLDRYGKITISTFAGGNPAKPSPFNIAENENALGNALFLLKASSIEITEALFEKFNEEFSNYGPYTQRRAKKSENNKHGIG